MLVMLFWLVWQYFSVQTKYNKGRFKVMATLDSGIDVAPGTFCKNIERSP